MHTTFKEKNWSVDVESSDGSNSSTNITYAKEEKGYKATIKVTEVKHHAHYRILGKVEQSIDGIVIEDNKAEFEDSVKRNKKEHARYLELEGLAYHHAEILRNHIDQAYFGQD